MSVAEYEYPPGPLTRFRRGMVSGASAWLFAFAMVTVACVLAWFPNPGSGVRISSAIKAALVVTAAGNLGGATVNAVHVTVPPLTVTFLLVVVLRHAARHADGRSGLAGMVLAYALATSISGSLGLGTTSAGWLGSLCGAALLAAAVGGWTFAGDALRQRVGTRVLRVARAATAAALVYVAAGSVAVAIELGMHLTTGVDLQRDLAVGASGLPVLLLGLAVVPNMVVAGAGVLAGGTASFGGHSSVSLWSVHHGRLPEFPLLAAVPDRPVPLAVAIGLFVGAALLAGRMAWRFLPHPDSLLHTATNTAAVAALTGVFAGLATGIAEGGAGSRAMAHIGGIWWQAAVFMALTVGLSTALWAAIEAVRGREHAGRGAGDGASHEAVPASELAGARK